MKDTNDTTLTDFEKLSKIQVELKAPKNQFNKFGNYNYRSCEDILEAVKPLLRGLVLTISDTVNQVGDRYYVVATAELYNSDGRVVASSRAYARESMDKKGMDDAQITGAASSYARKYALNGLFLIDDTNDADTQDNSEASSKSKKTTSTTQSSTDGVRTTSKEPASAQQIGKIGVLANKYLNISNMQLSTVTEKLYGIKQLPQLNKSQASDLIKKLQGKLAKEQTPKEVKEIEEKTEETITKPTQEDIEIDLDGVMSQIDGELPKDDEVLVDNSVDDLTVRSEEIKKEAVSQSVPCSTKGCINKVASGIAERSVSKYGKVLCMACQLKQGAIE